MHSAQCTLHRHSAVLPFRFFSFSFYSFLYFSTEYVYHLIALKMHTTPSTKIFSNTFYKRHIQHERQRMRKHKYLSSSRSFIILHIWSIRYFPYMYSRMHRHSNVICKTSPNNWETSSATMQQRLKRFQFHIFTIFFFAFCNTFTGAHYLLKYSYVLTKYSLRILIKSLHCFRHFSLFHISHPLIGLVHCAVSL